MYLDDWRPARAAWRATHKLAVWQSPQFVCRRDWLPVPRSRPVQAPDFPGGRRRTRRCSPVAYGSRSRRPKRPLNKEVSTPRRNARRPSITDSTPAECVATPSVKTSLTTNASIKTKVIATGVGSSTSGGPRSVGCTVGPQPHNPSKPATPLRIAVPSSASVSSIASICWRSIPPERAGSLYRVRYRGVGF